VNHVLIMDISNALDYRSEDMLDRGWVNKILVSCLLQRRTRRTVVSMIRKIGRRGYPISVLQLLVQLVVKLFGHCRGPLVSVNKVVL